MLRIAIPATVLLLTLSSGTSAQVLPPIGGSQRNDPSGDGSIRYQDGAPANKGHRDDQHFYRALPYGSQAGFSPLAAIIHSGYYNFQVDNRSRDPFAVPYGTGFDNVMKNLLHPIDALEKHGLGKFITSEVLPNLDRESAQWVPNYFGHIFGEGLAFRMSYEWYRHHRVPYSRVLAIVTLYSGSLLNEVVENGSFDGVNVDPIADIFIFNPLGILLFSSERASRFLATSLGMVYWPRQAAWNPVSGGLENIGYRTVFRVQPRGWRTGLFAMYGTESLIGLSHRLEDGLSVSVGGGAAAEELIEVDGPRDSRTVTATIGPAAGIFLDRNGSLLASVVLTPTKADKLTVNLYPGVVGAQWLRLGLWAGWNRDVGLKLGLQLAYCPVGVALQTGR